MKSLLLTLFTIVCLVIGFATVNASGGDNTGSNAPGDQHSWKPVDVWCYDYMGNFRMVTQCDESGGACSDQYCPCSGIVFEM